MSNSSNPNSNSSPHNQNPNDDIQQQQQQPVPIAQVIQSHSETKASQVPTNNNDTVEDDTSSTIWGDRQSLALSNLVKLYDQGFELAGAAKDAVEKLQDYELAAGLLSQAVDTFVQAAEIEPDPRKVELVEREVNQYLIRLQVLKDKVAQQQQQQQQQQEEAAAAAATTAATNQAANEINAKLQSAQFYLEQAMVADERGGKDDNPLSLYEKAAGLYLELSRSNSPFLDQTSKPIYLKRTSDILDRMEQLKKTTNTAKNVNSDKKSSSQNTNTGKGKGNNRASPPRHSGGRLTDAEKKVLASSSRINGRIYLPWLGSLEAGERFTTSKPFIDPDGLLQLSAKQKKHLKKWARPSEFMSNGSSSSNNGPTMIKLISPYTIRQELVTDCSFVSSLCIAASYERRSGKQLITSIIYPQNRNGIPLYNPCGKYMVKLWLNGVARKVIVDDLLPIGRRSNGSVRLLGSYTTSKNELWVSIIEKAYMKIHGGYDFPGSNSGIDLYALTGWIPEGFHMHDEKFQKHRTWQRLVNAHKYGDCLVTVATGQMPDEKADALGLVPTHAYAVLDVREACGVRMVLVKNPWAHMRWKGKYSPEDTKSWTVAMRRALRYDQLSAMQRDNGIFWIDYASMCEAFNGLYLNWNRDLFQHHTSHHRFWPANDHGPKNDSYNVGYNPQYTLTVQAPAAKDPSLPKSRSSSAVWLLLSRHVVSKRAESDTTPNQYLTLHVYKNKKRMFYPQKPYISAPYSNNPHTLVRFDVPPGETLTYTIVVSQYEKEFDLSYTLDVFSMANFRLVPLSRTLGSEVRLDGKWSSSSSGGKVSSAGGSARHITFMNNPQFRLKLAAPTKGLRLRLRAPKELHVNIRIMNSNGRLVDDVTNKNAPEMISSGDYRPGFCYAEINGTIPAGDYTIIPSTWKPEQEGPFFLYVETSHKSGSEHCKVGRIPIEGHGKRNLKLKGRWSFAAGTAVGCANYENYANNPLHKLHLTKASHVLIRLQMTSLQSQISTCLVVKSDATNKTVAKTNNGVYTNKICGVKTIEFTVEEGTYSLIPSTFKPAEGEYTLFVYTSDGDARLV